MEKFKTIYQNKIIKMIIILIKMIIKIQKVENNLSKSS